MFYCWTRDPPLGSSERVNQFDNPDEFDVLLIEFVEINPDGLITWRGCPENHGILLKPPFLSCVVFTDPHNHHVSILGRSLPVNDKSVTAINVAAFQAVSTNEHYSRVSDPGKVTR